ncbi:MAG TPA: hypothetical protein VKJ00_07470 [Thermoanaerobaculia bacterium]|nr:hypothetical protein [Thermoanaerobaculia bacterium]
MAIRIRPVAGEQLGILAGSNALDLEDSGVVHFAIEIADDAELDALCHARRAMLREERTRGRQWDEPSLEEAVFTRSEISWRVRPGQRSWCLQKIEELNDRSNQLLRATAGV